MEGSDRFKIQIISVRKKALSSQDVPFTFTTALIYELPFGRNKPLLKSGIGAAVLGGWQIGTVLRYQSGVPVSFGCAAGIPGWQNCIRFNRTSESPLSQSVLNGTFDPFADKYFNGLCTYVGQTGCGFADPNNQLIAANSSVTLRNARGGTYVLGNYPRNNGDARGPGFMNEDFSVIRNFHLVERASFQIKGEFLNAFNRHIFSLPGDAAPYDSLNGGNFGLVNGTIDNQRVIQLSARINF